MAGHQRAVVVAVDGLQVIAVAMALSLEQVGVELEAVTHVPVQRGAVLHGFIDALGGQAENRPRVHQVVGQRAGAEAVVMVAVPVAQQAALAAKEQVVAPRRVGTAPVAGLVDEGLAARSHLTVLDQADLDFIDAAGQHRGIQGLQTRLHRLAVDQHAIAVDLGHGRAIGGDVDRRGAGRAAVDHQAVAAAEHHAQGGVGARPHQAWLTGQALGAGGEVAETIEMFFDQALGVQLVKVVTGVLLAVAATVELAVGQGRPVAQAALALQGVAATGAAFVADQVELVAQQQAVAALLGQAMKALAQATGLGAVGQQRQL
ncbi:hypothetical protein D3C76_920330 [compost metagenome]